jgi:deoxyribodipyrimidine photo-lyase
VADIALVWMRRDLRIVDHPPLQAALAGHDAVVPAFCLDPRLLGGRHPSAARANFLLESLSELGASLRERGGRLAIRTGKPHEELVRLAREVGASAVYLASDVSPYARARDEVARRSFEDAGLRVVHTPGNFVADVGRPRTRDGRPYSVFSPFHRAWRELPRRAVLAAPDELPVPSRLRTGRVPTLADLGLELDVPEPLPSGEAAGRERLEAFMAGPIQHYADNDNRLAGGTSVLSPYLHFGCVSAREAEERAKQAGRGKGPTAFRRQLAWRDFYAHVLLHHPDNARGAHHQRYDALEWDTDAERLAAWKEGRTGYPLVDAAMRQLTTIGWMHNRARLTVGSFLTKDLHLDWREGEAHFMRYLLCGDEAQNNGNWQRIAGTGVDPQPFFRRMYNPTLHQERYDPDGEYVRRWVPELRDVPLERLAEPWTMDDDEQEAAGCVIGRDYPAPIVDHQAERREAMERYQRVS